MFQSAPRVRTRGDQDPEEGRRGLRSFNPRPAFARGATRWMRELPHFTLGFNPRPAFARGATYGDGDGSGYGDVSIRAPRSHAGRLAAGLAAGRDHEFQSAPRVRTRGDAHGRALCPDRGGFQSAPRVRTRGDRWRCPLSSRWTCFNPRPAFAR